MTGWITRNKAWIAIVIPYIALSIAIVAFIGVYNTRANQIELEIQFQADRAAERAKTVAEDTARELARSCLDRQQARQDVDEILLTLAAALQPRARETLTALILARPPVNCP